MKVIVASYPKCGTKTLHQCLEILGYSVHDFDSQSYYFGDEWMHMLTYGCDTRLLRKMYRDVDSVCDVPACYFWEEILRAFPDAKVVLTVRDENDWLKSMQNQAKMMDSSKLLKLYMIFTPTGRQLAVFWRRMGEIILGCPPLPYLKFFQNPNEELQKKLYTRHNDAVIKRAPKEQLLIFNLSEGWKPLCDFLGTPIPDVPFPRANVGGALAVDMFQLPLFDKMKHEFRLFQATSILIIAIFFMVLLSIF